VNSKTTRIWTTLRYLAVIPLIALGILSIVGKGGGDTLEVEGCLVVLGGGIGPDCPPPPPPDTTPPTTPGNLVTDAVSPAQIDLSWGPSTDDGVLWKYRIYRDGKFLKSASTTSASDTGLDPSTQYCYTVAAVDRADNESAPNSGACAATPGDVIPPATPTGLTVVSVSSGTQDLAINLSWNTSSDNGVVRGYKIYRDGIQIQDATATSFSDAGLSSNIQYCYTVSAYDAAANESAQSTPACATTSWNITTVDDQVSVQETALAIDSSDHVHISYFDRKFGPLPTQRVRDLKYATNGSGSWSTRIVENLGTSSSSTSIAVDPTDAVHIGYRTSSGVRHATNVSGQWVSEMILVAADARTVSLALDSASRIHLAYTENADLLYATNAGGIWTTEVVDNVSAIVVGPTTAAIAVDASSSVHIGYTDFPNRDLKYATNASGSWSTETVDSQSDVSTDVAIAVDAASNVHLSYYDEANRDLKYATNASGIWATQTIDSQGEVGTSTSITVDSAGKTHISYTDDTNHDLKYATNLSGSWNIYTIDSAARVGGTFISPRGYTGIAVDSTGKVHISYQGNTELRYATNR